MSAEEIAFPCIIPFPRLGAGALMLNAWDWTVTIPKRFLTKIRSVLGLYFPIISTVWILGNPAYFKKC